ncbi:histone-like nucleoid-structuring protein Lsr2 [Aestuariimicrobium sp. T2.26MG-19.2B]|uniref:histone-like nucleoid-structuring protein Lsr2 n=1 Tax=Aestuariimicrobium sp. T2.26MG-19.2B TaxID=3040679 RepID=UPI0024777537|nr:Lsr2 family protein [Aestuariimicrobium sp. T2.26MG-19.2B]CAI9411488.1 Nucleoid-associated protein Lsr2 [Aestuariimicrobium sp. T2.26MG-19.2B]
MAQRVNVVLEDDIDGTPADVTVSFAFDGTAYEIDLSEANAAQLREVVAPWVAHARKAARPAGRRRGPRQGTGSTNEIREWARAQGMNVSERGRVPAAIREAFSAAH